jgi:hypothetical protein
MDVDTSVYFVVPDLENTKNKENSPGLAFSEV